MSLLYNNLTAKFEFVRAQFRSTAYGHAGIGGSIAFCDPSVGLSVAITVNRLTIHPKAVIEVVNTICEHLGPEVGFPIDLFAGQ